MFGSFLRSQFTVTVGLRKPLLWRRRGGRAGPRASGPPPSPARSRWGEEANGLEVDLVSGVGDVEGFFNPGHPGSSHDVAGHNTSGSSSTKRYKNQIDRFRSPGSLSTRGLPGMHRARRSPA